MFAPLLKGARYLAIHGGRASGKSHFVAEWVIEQCILRPGLRVLCAREVQKSLNQSVKKLLEDKIEKLGVGHMFEVQQSQIIAPNNGLIIFQGLATHTADSIKSLEGIDIAWLEESQSISEQSFTILRPTIRKPGSMIVCTWNPRSPKDPIDNFFRGAHQPPDSIIVEANYNDNPFLPDVMVQELEYDKSRDMDKFLHVWKGGYQTLSEARVFKNWTTDYFDTPDDARFYFGLDFGYSKDPTFFVRCFIGRFENGKAIADPKGRKLFIDHEQVKLACEIDKTPALLDKIPQSKNYMIRADNARPETISYLKRNGYPKMISSTKGKNSIIEGIEFIRSFDVIIHERCTHMIDNFTHYKHKVDPKTEEILNDIEDANNDGPDALRYALELIRKAEKDTTTVSLFGPKIL